LITTTRTLFSKNLRVYGDAAAFRTKFYNVEEFISFLNITPADYKEFFPMFVFDVSKQSEKLKNSVTDIQIKAQFSANVGANTEAVAVVISNKSHFPERWAKNAC